MLLVIILAILLAYKKGYDVKRLINCKAMYPLFFLELVFIVFQTVGYFGYYEVTKYASVLKTLHLYSLILLMVVYKLYKQGFISSALMLIGTALNNIAIASNGGNMPVYPSLSYLTGFVKEDSFDKIHTIHVLGTEAHQFKILTDYIDIGFAILSVGDLFIHAFTFIIVYYTIKSLNVTLGSN